LRIRTSEWHSVGEKRQWRFESDVPTVLECRRL
jgi:hypothetical protein